MQIDLLLPSFFIFFLSSISKMHSKYPFMIYLASYEVRVLLNKTVLNKVTFLILWLSVRQ